jgi:hypothetical protein
VYVFGFYLCYVNDFLQNQHQAVTFFQAILEFSDPLSRLHRADVLCSFLRRSVPPHLIFRKIRSYSSGRIFLFAFASSESTRMKNVFLSEDEVFFAELCIGAVW